MHEQPTLVILKILHMQENCLTNNVNVFHLLVEWKIYMQPDRYLKADVSIMLPVVILSPLSEI